MVIGLKEYLHESLGVSCSLVGWDFHRLLPMTIRDQYDSYVGDILDIPVVFMFRTDESEPSPAVVEKHRNTASKLDHCEIVFVFDYLEPHNRKRLIERKIPFVVIGTQMYLPFLGIELREHLRRIRKSPVQQLSPSSQAVLLTILYRRMYQSTNVSELARSFNYSPITMSRVVDEFVGLKLVQEERHGRQRRISFPLEGLELWYAAVMHMTSPVLKRVSALFEDEDSQFSIPLCGETALSSFTNLADPGYESVAVTKEKWDTLLKDGHCTIPKIREDATTIVEIWKYPPIEVVPGHVDPLSLILSVTPTRDERVLEAIDILMRQMQW